MPKYRNDGAKAKHSVFGQGWSASDLRFFDLRSSPNEKFSFGQCWSLPSVAREALARPGVEKWRRGSGEKWPTQEWRGAGASSIVAGGRHGEASREWQAGQQMGKQPRQFSGSVHCVRGAAYLGPHQYHQEQHWDGIEAPGKEHGSRWTRWRGLGKLGRQQKVVGTC